MDMTNTNTAKDSALLAATFAAEERGTLVSHVAASRAPGLVRRGLLLRGANLNPCAGEALSLTTKGTRALLAALEEAELVKESHDGSSVRVRFGYRLEEWLPKSFVGQLL